MWAQCVCVSWLLFLALQVCRPPINLPGVLQHINSTSQAFNFIHALTQSIFIVVIPGIALRYEL